MTDSSFTRLTGNGVAGYGHSMTRISKNKFLVVGGKSNQVWVYDTVTSTWTEISPIHTIFGDRYDHHRAVVVHRENGVSVFCLGGYNPALPGRIPDKMLVFDIE